MTPIHFSRMVSVFLAHSDQTWGIRIQYSYSSVFEYSFWIIHHVFRIHYTKVFSNVFNTFEKYSVFNEYFMNTSVYILQKY